MWPSRKAVAFFGGAMSRERWFSERAFARPENLWINAGAAQELRMESFRNATTQTEYSRGLRSAVWGGINLVALRTAAVPLYLLEFACRAACWAAGSVLGEVLLIPTLPTLAVAGAIRGGRALARPIRAEMQRFSSLKERAGTPVMPGPGGDPESTWKVGDRALSTITESAPPRHIPDKVSNTAINHGVMTQHLVAVERKKMGSSPAEPLSL